MAKAKLTSKKRGQLRKRLKEIEGVLKILQTQFRDIKKRSRTLMEKTVSRRDAKKIEEMQKRLGL